ncbi:Uncharacterised protein [Vibrio cholerae]|nr:Uncharacterised protein [Vibrio cholerae]
MLMTGNSEVRGGSFPSSTNLLTLAAQQVYPSYLKLQRCWLRSLTPSHSLSMLMGTHSLAAYLQLQVVWV